MTRRAQPPGAGAASSCWCRATSQWANPLAKIITGPHTHAPPAPPSHPCSSSLPAFPPLPNRSAGRKGRVIRDDPSKYPAKEDIGILPGATGEA
jgi:hypothetical protein